uniref:Methyltransferase domain-containing protein n=1 Tax=Scophthalmus maximus TaxID=52904 RepID=A0A8D3CQ10_SCOMX
MSDSSRTVEDVRVVLQTYKSVGPCAKDLVKFYDTWAETYDKDLTLMSYRAPHLAVTFLSENFTGTPEEALVLDVACGTGWVMVELGFRRFVGVDGSKGMLDQAAESGLYQDLNQALLGSDPLPAQPGVFDVVMMVGGLGFGFAPISVVRELCLATKPGGLVCLTIGDQTGRPAAEFREDLWRELQLMEEEGLWSRVGIRLTDRYRENPHVNPERDEDDVQHYISGSVYLFKKSSN